MRIAPATPDLVAIGTPLLLSSRSNQLFLRERHHGAVRHISARPTHAPTRTPPAVDRPRGMSGRALHALASTGWPPSTAHAVSLRVATLGAGRCRGGRGVQGRHPRRAATANTPAPAYPTRTHISDTVAGRAWRAPTPRFHGQHTCPRPPYPHAQTSQFETWFIRSVHTARHASACGQCTLHSSTSSSSSTPGASSPPTRSPSSSSSPSPEQTAPLLLMMPISDPSSLYTLVAS